MKNAVITGAANGMGNIAANLLVDQGWRVFALDIDQNALDRISTPGIVPVHVDVADSNSVAAAAEIVSKQADELDLIANFAGIAFMSSLVEGDPDMVQRLMDINVMGMVRITKAFFPLVYKGKGRIVNISSEAGWLPVPPFNGAYAMSKRAVEAYSDSLRRELQLLGIKVIKMQLGAFGTGLFQAVYKSYATMLETTRYYREPLKRAAEAMDREMGKPNDFALMVEAFRDAVFSDQPKICYRVANSPAFIQLSMLPDETVDEVLLRGHGG